MIQLNHPASVFCDEPGCGTSQPCTMVLRADGGFGAVPQSTAWQLLGAANGTLLVRCPEHARAQVEVKKQPVRRKGAKT